LQQTNFIILTYRFFRLFIHIIVGLLIVASIWSLSKKATKKKLIKWWSRILLKCFGVHVILHGKRPAENLANTLFLTNHVSWLDIYALNSITPLQFIAKSDINNWPILGYLVRKSGTIFINRNSRKDTSRIVDTTTQILVGGGNVGFFPEGTTTDGTTIERFKSSIVQAAINAKSTIYPVAIRYPLPNGGINTAIAYAGETSMGEAMMNALKQKNTIVELHFLAPINLPTANRQTLTQLAFEEISRTLKL
jgi:1-acyl-sn-glycerol-3-phosphate acyltransferase